MKYTIYNKYNKAWLSDLKPVRFGGRIVVVLNEQEAQRAVGYLLTRQILGVDTETRPSFRKGPMNKVSLLQVSDHDVCFLFRLKYLGMSPSVRLLLEDVTVPKVGLSWHDDLMQLHRLGDFEAGNFIDLQHHVREIGVEDLSLQKLFANFFGRKISKSQQLTNWDADVLTDKQKVYAATDAWSCILLYEKLQSLKETGNYELITVNENDIQADTTQKG